METGNRKERYRPFTIRERLDSIRNAIHGLKTIIRSEHNFRIHLVVLAAVILAGILLGISRAEWIAVSLAAGAVLAGECFNTAIEFLADRVSPGRDDIIRRVKDITASGVLILAMSSVIVGLIIFLPHLIKFLK